MASVGAKPATRRQFGVAVRPYLGYVSAFSGGHPSQPSGKVFQGGAVAPDVLMGRRTHSDVTVRQPYRPLQTRPVAAAMFATMTTQIYTITINTKDEHGHYIGRPRVLTGCRLTAINYPEYDENTDADPAFLECVFAVGGQA